LTRADFLRDVIHFAYQEVSDEVFLKLKRYIGQNQQTFSDKSEPTKEIDKIVAIFRDWVLAV